MLKHQGIYSQGMIHQPYKKQIKKLNVLYKQANSYIKAKKKENKNLQLSDKKIQNNKLKIKYAYINYIYI